MGTRSHIYIETEPGMFLGTDCQFDGYPSHMFPQLEQRSHIEVYGIIIKGQTRGGRQAIHSTKGVEYKTECLIHFFLIRWIIWKAALLPTFM